MAAARPASDPTLGVRAILTASRSCSRFPWGARQLPVPVQIIRAGPHIARGLGSYMCMYRYGFGRRRERFDGRRWRTRSRAVGCLLWVVVLIVILVVLALMFGGF